MTRKAKVAKHKRLVRWKLRVELGSRRYSSWQFVETAAHALSLITNDGSRFHLQRITMTAEEWAAMTEAEFEGW